MIISDRLTIIVLVLTVVRGLVSGLQPFMYSTLLWDGLPPADFAVRYMQFTLMFSVVSWMLFLVFLLTLFFLYKPLNFGKEYKWILLKLFLGSFIGLFFGGVVGYMVGVIYVGQHPQIFASIMQGLSSAGMFLLYGFAGFAITALSYFRRGRGESL